MIEPYDISAQLKPSGAKICGIRSVADYQHCTKVGAAFIGMVFFEKSPRHLSFQEAEVLKEVATSDGPIRVALVVDATDAYLADICHYANPDMIQLHGNETPQRCADIRRNMNRPVMKALRIKDSDDVAQAASYLGYVDWLLFDADSGNPDMPGGTGHHFNWQLLAGLDITIPWMLAGGLKPDNLAQAKAQTLACYFDVSSAVEAEKGVKDHALISAFVKAAQ